MSNNDAIRWLQRLEHFETALAKLTDACKRENYTELELAGVIQFFVFSQELAWNTLKDLLYVEGIDAKTPRAVWREAHSAGFVDDIDTALGTIAFRNELSDYSSEAIVRRAGERIHIVYLPLLTQVLGKLQEKRERERAA